MKIACIAALEQNRGIGWQGTLPWHLRSDLQRFKFLTMGHYLIQGRKTVQSIGRPLPGRNMVVITRQPDFSAPGCAVVNSLQDALHLASQAGESMAFIGGGAEIFQAALPLTDYLFLTRIHAQIQTDIFFPEINVSNWRLIWQEDHIAGEHDEFDFTFEKWERTQINT